VKSNMPPGSDGRTRFDPAVPMQCKNKHPWTAPMYFELGGWFFVNEKDGDCPTCGKEGSPVEAVAEKRNQKKPRPDQPTESSPEVRRQPSGTVAAALLGIAAALTPTRETVYEIPWGYSCTACGGTRDHREDCQPPRGLKAVQP
jgi:hypothetical protein